MDFIYLINISYNQKFMIISVNFSSIRRIKEEEELSNDYNCIFMLYFYKSRIKGEAVENNFVNLIKNSYI
jgi:hypothetical protein